MAGLEKLLAQNRAWAATMTGDDPTFFSELASQQSPEYLWIGCSDSRVPANQIVGLAPGELFVHRNVANVVVHTDLNCLSRAAVRRRRARGQARHRLRPLRLRRRGSRARGRAARADRQLAAARRRTSPRSTRRELGALAGERRLARLCELNVVEQVANVCQTTIVEDAWARGDGSPCTAWIYGLEDGLLRDLGISRSQGDGDGR